MQTSKKQGFADPRKLGVLGRVEFGGAGASSRPADTADNRADRAHVDDG